jgi:pimeloyl-ACP methyl ester carboxylesterase
MHRSISHSQKSTIGRARIHTTLLRSLSTVTPALAAAAAEQLFVTPMRVEAPDRERRWAASAESVTIPSPHGKLAAWVWGTGPCTVLLVHGWSGRGLQLGGFAAPLVAAGYRVVAYDAPAHGDSSGRRSNLFHHTDGLLAAARAFGPCAGVIAHSLGTASVLLAANRNALSPGRLVAVSPMAHTRTMTDWFGFMNGFSEPVVDRMRSRLEERYDFVWDEIEPHRLAFGLEADTLVIHDLDDRELPASEGHALADRLSSARLEFTRGLGHRRILRDPKVVTQAALFIATGHGMGEKPITPSPDSRAQSAA